MIQGPDLLAGEGAVVEDQLGHLTIKTARLVVDVPPTQVDVVSQLHGETPIDR